MLWTKGRVSVWVDGAGNAVQWSVEVWDVDMQLSRLAVEEAGWDCTPQMAFAHAVDLLNDSPSQLQLFLPL